MENKGWLHEYLSEVARYSYNDINEMKKGTDCFPPDYHVLDMFIKIQYSNLVKVVCSLLVLFAFLLQLM